MGEVIHNTFPKVVTKCLTEVVVQGQYRLDSITVDGIHNCGH